MFILKCTNCFQIHCGFSNISPDEACRRAKGLDTGQYKSIVADAVIEVLSPIREQFIRLRKDEDYLDSVLNQGSIEAGKVAKENWKEIQHLLGLCR